MTRNTAPIQSAYAYCDFVTSEFSTVQVCANSEGVCALLFAPEPGVAAKPNRHTDVAKQQLSEYFTGQRQHFDVPLVPQGTPFQQEVWHQLSQIPFGECRSYADIARAINRPKAVRAVGAANGRNSLPIFVPCHRVIGSNGTLTGFAGGLDMKAWLLKLEGYLS